MIIGLTDKRNFFPRLGKIRLGVRNKGGGFPQDTDHFVVTEFPEIIKVYGEKPKRLIVSFPANDIETVFPTRLENWKSRRPREGDQTTRNVLFCSSDGETATRMYIGERDAHGQEFVMKMEADDRPELGEMFQLPCPYETCPYYDIEPRQCRETGRLNFVLPEVTFKGTYQIETSSLYGFGNILDTLRWILRMTANTEWPKGRLAGAYFYLSRVPQSMSPGELKGKTIIKHVLALQVIDDQATIMKLGTMTPPWLRIGAPKALEAATDHPAELFPERVMPSLAPAEDDELEKMAAEAGLGKAEYELLGVKLGGDVDKIKAHLVDLLNEKDLSEAIPLTPEQPPSQVVTPPVVKKPSMLTDW